MEASTRTRNGFWSLARTEGIGRLMIAAVVLPIALWHGGAALVHRYHLEHDGNVQNAFVEELILKRCYGFRCSGPVLFEGEIGSPEYNEFSSRCGKSCWWLVRYRFSWGGAEYSITESVYPKFFDKLRVNSPLMVLVDNQSPRDSQLYDSTNDNGIIFAFMLICGLFLTVIFSIIWDKLKKHLIFEKDDFA